MNCFLYGKFYLLYFYLYSHTFRAVRILKPAFKIRTALNMRGCKSNHFLNDVKRWVNYYMHTN